MSVKYVPVIWNRTKLFYDVIVLAVVGAYLGVYIYVAPMFQTVTRPIDWDIYKAQAFGTCVFYLLTFILCIGPIARLDKRFLPLLYNRRHLGVITCVLAYFHVDFILGWYNAFSPINRYVSVFVVNTSFDRFLGFPFEILGVLALLILTVLAVTSHDFWLHFLKPTLWKILHMGIYLAYALIVAHVALGALQSAAGPFLTGVVGASLALVTTLHLLAARREHVIDTQINLMDDTRTWLDAGDPMEVPDKRAKIISLTEDERVAIFRNGTKLSAISNVCAHQNGPLGEGKIVYGCVTCPWHGYQYRLEDGTSPPPFTEKISTYRLKLENGRLWLNVKALPPGTYVEPVISPMLAGGS
ncbi:Anthranilate 1,2-dioxygenase ferredoxin subunit [Pseudovibrio axinellae]|uniref:Anthranilate 1,2-dioxygenase ferredoxin subunit n=1 Tax=Pseudovibrio axinellae TaxID=989403 RepID=A0A165ZRI7_9HYPH|nr:Rieske 2Fe-2S domain-containing protein [Pseudovibrio axinellae]KZL20205.1 Anthranilate 1,2-dioxygenase ferredoxin subunit [Pseudovibrio axinellae]SEQ60915.1 Ferredoxin subunit of nitrite reductase or a ring-hydroxylating dioxygenase [Pseudovibrio axinellae]